MPPAQRADLVRELIAAMGRLGPAEQKAILAAANFMLGERRKVRNRRKSRHRPLIIGKSGWRDEVTFR